VIVVDLLHQNTQRYPVILSTYIVNLERRKWDAILYVVH